jgi:hypothetical protein
MSQCPRIVTGPRSTTTPITGWYWPPDASTTSRARWRSRRLVTSRYAGQFQVTIPQADGSPLWSFLVIRPSASSGTNASGVELRNVRYRGKLVLFQAHAPILNVQYDGNACGPFRDWLFEESWVQADGTNVAPGIRRSQAPAQTILESGTDSGNFRGVAIYRQGRETVLVSELQAGWYRYVSRWRFHDNGTIRPRFGFSAVQDSCVCNVHHHHVYWRFDFDIGTTENNEVREFNSPPIFPPDNWHTFQFEARRRRRPELSRRGRSGTRRPATLTT